MNKAIAMDSFHRTYQYITHCNQRYSYLEGAYLALIGGCRWIQLRMKDASDEEVVVIAQKLKVACEGVGAVLILDDRVELARKLEVDGVHLGKNDMAPDEARQVLGDGYIIGGTANTFDDILRLHEQGVDYIGCGPYRYTTTKKKLSPVLGLDGYRHILSQMEEQGICMPMVAIGGILVEDIDKLTAFGMGIAVSGAVLNADNPVAVSQQITTKMIQQ